MQSKEHVTEALNSLPTRAARLAPLSSAPILPADTCSTVKDACPSILPAISDPEAVTKLSNQTIVHNAQPDAIADAGPLPVERRKVDLSALRPSHGNHNQQLHGKRSRALPKLPDIAPYRAQSGDPFRETPSTPGQVNNNSQQLHLSTSERSTPTQHSAFQLIQQQSSAPPIFTPSPTTSPADSIQLSRLHKPHRRVLFAEDSAACSSDTSSCNDLSSLASAPSAALLADPTTCRLLIHVVTYNMAGTLPKKLPKGLVMQGGKVPDMLVIGTQESCSLGDWEKLLVRHLGEAYVKVKTLLINGTGSHAQIGQESLMSISQLVFAHRRVAHQIKDVKTSSIACGVGNVLGNKGGVGISCTIHGARVLLVTCHLAAHDEYIERRNMDYSRIYNGLFSASATTGNPAVPASPLFRSGSVTPVNESPGGPSMILRSDDSVASSIVHAQEPSSLMSSPVRNPSVHRSRLARASSMAQIPSPIGKSPGMPGDAAVARSGPGSAPVMGSLGNSYASSPNLAAAPLSTDPDVAAQATPQTPVPSRHLDRANSAHTEPDQPSGTLPSPSPRVLLATQPSVMAVPAPSGGLFGSGSCRSSVIPLHDVVVWSGDLNYRINGTAPVVTHLLENDMHEVLHANDQLRIQMRKGKVFQDFHEQAINFPPTFKYKPFTQSYNMKRIPSWTDRILHAVYSHEADCTMQPLYYTDVSDLLDSDHRPVVAGYELYISQKLKLLSSASSGRACVIS